VAQRDFGGGGLEEGFEWECVGGGGGERGS